MKADDFNRMVLQGIIDGKQHQPKEHAKPIVSEETIQVQCVNWFRMQYSSLFDRGLLIHIANERHCSARQGKRYKDMGVRKGIPDLQLFVARHGYHGMLIEMKKPHEYPRAEQRELMSNLEREGYLCKVCRSLDEFRTIINDYLIQ